MHFLNVPTAIFIIVAVRTSRGSLEDIVCAYSKQQLLSNCFGEKATKNHYHKIREASRECQNLTPTSPAAGEEGHRMQKDRQAESTSKSFVAKQNPWFSNFNWEDLFDSSKSISVGDKRKINQPNFASHPNKTFLNVRKKRQLQQYRFSAIEETVTKRKHQLTHKISNFSCILKKLKYINEENQLEYNYMVLETRSLGYPQQLQEEIIEGMKHCKETSSHQAEDGRQSTSLPSSLKNAMAFLKCEEQKRLTACIKYSFYRQRQDIEFLEGLDLTMADIENEDQLLTIINSDKYTKF